MARDTNKLKALIFDTLNDDVPLRTLLGGVDRVRHGNPDQLSQYPLVTYSILTELDEVYDTDIPCNITDSRVLVICYSTETSSEQVSDLSDRVYVLLHGQNLSDANVQVYTSYRQTSEPIFEPEVKVWRVVSSYSMVNVTL